MAAMKHWPDITTFLGYDPTPEPTTMGQQTLAHRRRHGLSRKALSGSLNIDEATLCRWELDKRTPKSTPHLLAVALLRL